jgi:phage terminase large subunit GpA-like protein
MNVAKALASGTIHLPNHLDAGYFDQLSSERLTVRYVKGFPRYQWEKEPNVRNEAFDTLVLATAAATLVNGRAQSASKPKASKPKLSIAELGARLNPTNRNQQHV